MCTAHIRIDRVTAYRQTRLSHDVLCFHLTNEDSIYYFFHDFCTSNTLVTYSLHLANAWSGGFSFDCPIGQSIGELSPCVPRFCYYERNCFVSTQSQTKSMFFGENQEIFLSASSSTPNILKPSLQILIAAFSSRFIWFPQVQLYIRSSSFSSFLSFPQQLQIFELGYHLSIRTSFLPARANL